MTTLKNKTPIYLSKNRGLLLNMFCQFYGEVGIHLPEPLFCLGVELIGKQLFNVTKSAYVHLANFIGLLVGAGFQLNYKLIVHFKDRNQVTGTVYAFDDSHAGYGDPCFRRDGIVRFGLY